MSGDFIFDWFVYRQELQDDYVVIDVPDNEASADTRYVVVDEVEEEKDYQEVLEDEFLVID